MMNSSIDRLVSGFVSYSYLPKTAVAEWRQMPGVHARTAKVMHLPSLDEIVDSQLSLLDLSTGVFSRVYRLYSKLDLI